MAQHQLPLLMTVVLASRGTIRAGFLAPAEYSMCTKTWFFKTNFFNRRSSIRIASRYRGNIANEARRRPLDVTGWEQVNSREEGWSSWGSMQEERAQPRPRPARKSEKQEDRSSSQEEGLPRGGVAVEEEDLFGREFEVSDDDFIGSPGRFRSSRRRGKETSSNDDQDEFTASTSGREASTTSTREVRGAWRRGNVQEEDDIAEDDDFAEELGKPIVIPLTRGEADFVLPLAPIGPQVQFYSGDAQTNLRRAGVSLAAAILLSKVVILAATAATYALWAPWAEAAWRNVSVKKLSHAGLWLARVLEIETYQAREPTFDAATKGKGKVGTTLRVVVGDDSGAEASLEVPLRKAYANIMEGDPVLAVVVSDSAELDRFRVVRDVYLPETRAWLAEYPFVDRGAFLALVQQLKKEEVI